MARHILVPLKSTDRIEEIIPDIEEIGQPGMRVVFLMPYKKDRKTTMEYAHEEQTRLAEQKLYAACKTLYERGVDLIVYIYMNRLKRVLKSYKRNGIPHVIVVPKGNGHPVRRLLSGFFAFFKRRSFSPVALGESIAVP